MIPGFVTIYIDKDNYKHLYFYPGLSDDEEPIYRNIELPNCQLKYDRIIKKSCPLKLLFLLDSIYSRKSFSDIVKSRYSFL